MITAEQYDRLNYIAKGDWAGSPTKFLDSVESSEELLYLSTIEIWEYEDDYDDYHMFLRHSLCDVSMAYIVFWSQQPAYSYWKRITNRPLSGSELRGLEFCDGIVEMVHNWTGVKGSYGYSPVDSASESAKRNWDCVPEIMKIDTDGPFVDPLWFLKNRVQSLRIDGSAQQDD